MKTTLKLDKIEKSTSGVKFAHIMLTLDTSKEKSGFASGHWGLICTSMAVTIKGNNNINSLRWFLKVLEKETKTSVSLESRIRAFAGKVINADDLMDKTQDIII